MPEPCANAQGPWQTVLSLSRPRIREAFNSDRHGVNGAATDGPSGGQGKPHLTGRARAAIEVADKNRLRRGCLGLRRFGFLFGCCFCRRSGNCHRNSSKKSKRQIELSHTSAPVSLNHGFKTYAEVWFPYSFAEVWFPYSFGELGTVPYELILPREVCCAAMLACASNMWAWHPHIRFMSRAFVKQETAETFDDLPERPVSEHPNYVTAEGLAQIEAELARLSQEQAEAIAAEDRAGMARAARDLRYWTARRSTAQLIPPPEDCLEVRFGCTVTLVRDDGRKQTFRIVGEDEADPAKGTISHAAPLARALVGKKVGDVVPAGRDEAEIVAIGT
jgi:transcription elongation GreA/GreB family factor